MPSVYAACPSTRDFSVQYVESLFLTRYPGPMAWSALLNQDIQTARNLICERFLKSGMDFLLMHDSDATWHPDAIARLASRNLPAVTGMIFMRRIPPIPSVGQHTAIYADGSHIYSFGETVNRLLAMNKAGRFNDCSRNEILFDPRADDLQEIDGAGAHFMLIRRDVIEKIGSPWYVCTEHNSGEGFDFCRRAQAAGFKLYADWSVFTGHVAGPGITLGVREFLACWAEQVDIPWTSMKGVSWTA